MSGHEESRGTIAAYPAGQYLQCDICDAEIMIVKPCTAHPPDQVFECCGKDMVPSVRPEPSQDRGGETA